MELTDGTLCLSHRPRPPVRQEPVPDLPCEDPRVSALVVPDPAHHVRRGDARLAAADGSGQNRAGLEEPDQDLADPAVGDAQLAADVAGSDPQLGHLHDADPGRVGERPSVDEDPSELVHLPVGLVCGSRSGTGEREEDTVLETFCARIQRRQGLSLNS